MATATAEAPEPTPVTGSAAGDESVDPADEAENDEVNGSDASASKPSTRTSAQDRERDKELVALAQKGDQDAFRELFDRYHRRAFAVALGVVKNKQDALDIIQDAFIKVHKHIQSFQGTASFYTWLYRIVMNLSIDHVRKAKKGRDLDYDDKVGRDDENVAGDGAILPTILDANPRRTVMRRELADAIQGALDTLSEDHRAVILLREVEGLSYEEMARVLEVPKGTIMSRLFHARRNMQQALAEYVQGDLDIQ
ncbi:MAG: RNA polymerase subunit sigma [Sandaracinus sp.]|nr:RNA polymerase subunit sigma [Sandaracinus sp.]MAQ15064.1 RNA polymerase subunit sigma [Sandaracinus sp.]|tara:strand:- start:1448 stop:2206 length:759 start_codon:yes stop_codon:yes gene_type:complete